MIFAALFQDGMTSGAIYALIALTLVLVFSVTRIIFIPQGEFVAYGALTFTALQANLFPATVWFVLLLGFTTFALNALAFTQQASATPDSRRRLGYSALLDIGLPVGIFLAVSLAHRLQAGSLAQILLTLLIITPMGRYIYRITYQRVAESSILLLLIVSVALHLVMVGMGLVMFGPEGARARAIWETSFNLGTISLSGQSFCILVAAVLVIGAMYYYFSRTLLGSALKATAINRVGATLMGVETRDAGSTALIVAAGIGGLCGILIAPVTTVYYDSGFLVALKGFVGAIIGGLASYPIAAVGAVFVGILESFSSFYASAYKEVVVFTLIIPVLLWMSLKHPKFDDCDE